MNSLIQADIVSILKDVIYALIVGLLGYVFPLIKKIAASLLAKIPANERSFLETAAKDAVVFVEVHFQGEGKAKFDQAVSRVTTVLEDHGLKISPTDVEQAIEAAYQKVKGDLPVVAPVVTPVGKVLVVGTQPTPAPTPAPDAAPVNPATPE